MAVEPKRALIEPTPPPLRSRRPWAVLGFARSTREDQPRRARAERRQRRRWLDEPYPVTPCDGLRRMPAWWRQRGDAVHPTRMGRLLRPMGLAAISPKPRLSQPAAGQTIDPSLWRGVTGDRGNQVWSAASTASRAPGRGCLSGRGHGRVPPVWAVLDNREHHGRGVVCRGAGPSARARAPGEVQDGPGRSVHQSGVHGTAAGRRAPPQDGGPRPGPGYRVRGAVMAHSDGGGGLSARR